MESLAQELIDTILDILYQDAPCYLRVTSLVCRSWFPTSQRLLFRKVNLESGYRDQVPIPMSRRLYRVLLDSPHLADYVKELVVRTTVDSIDDTLPLVLHRLTNLEGMLIDLCDMCWADLDLDIRQAFLRALQSSSMRWAEMISGSFINLNELGGFLYHTRGLNRLFLSVDFDKPQESLMEGKDDEDKLERLGLDKPRHLSDLALDLNRYFNYPIFFDWLLGPRSHFKVSHIHTLRIIGIIPETCGDDINRLLQATGDTLKHLHLHIPQVDASGLTGLMAVEFNSDIKSLHFSHMCVSNTTSDELSWILHLLSTINTFDQLQTVKLHGDLPSGVTAVKLPAWGTVNRILAGSHFKSLKKLDIELHRKEPWVETVEDMVAMFPLLSSLGVAVQVQLISGMEGHDQH